MATINLGRVKPVFRGAYSGATAYVVDDIVTYSNETYICILASTGNLPTDTTYWTKLAAKGVDGTDLTSTLTTQGDILYRDGSGLQRLGAGTSGQVLQSGGTGANPSWVDQSGGAIAQVQYRENATQYTNSSNTTYVEATDHYVDITPTSSSNTILLCYNINLYMPSGSSDIGLQTELHRTVGGTTTTIRTSSTTEFYHYDSSGGQSNRQNGTIWFLDTPSTTSAIRYSFRFRNPHSSIQIRVGDNNNPTQITAFEINV